MMKRISICFLLLFSARFANAQSYGPWQFVTSVSQVPFNDNVMEYPTNDTGFFFGTSLDIWQGDSASNYVELPKLPHPSDTFPIDSSGVIVKDFSHYTAIQTIADMSWPTQNAGFILGETNQDNYGHTSRPIVITTTNTGATWNSYYPTDTADQYTNICFPTTTTGYVSITNPNDGSSTIAKSINGGQTWTQVLSSDTMTFKNMYFRDATHGLIYANGGADNTTQIEYTFDGSTFHLVTVPDSVAYFLSWENDSSWIVGGNNVYRSTDSGKTWPVVLTYDPVNGPASVGAFHDSVGFVFRANTDIGAISMNYGKSWTQDTLKGNASDSITPLAASMPSSAMVYALLTDQSQTQLILEKSDYIPAKTSGGGGGSGVADDNSIIAVPFSVMLNDASVQFSMAPIADQRNIEILDVLGRARASVSIAPSMSNAQLSMSALTSGTYFARLGTSIVKFAIP